MQIINWDLASHPMNWATVFLMVFLASIVVHLILSALAPEEKPQA